MPTNFARLSSALFPPRFGNKMCGEPTTAAVTSIKPRLTNLVALGDGFKSLAEINELQSDIVELRFFGGLSIEDTAEVLKLSPTTIERDWTMAKAWLRKTVMSNE